MADERPNARHFLLELCLLKFDFKPGSIPAGLAQ